MRGGIPDPLETRVAALLREAGIRFVRPESDLNYQTNLDFLLPDFGLFIEVKQFHTPRIADQLSKVPRHMAAMVLMGPGSIKAFERLVATLAKPKSPAS